MLGAILTAAEQTLIALSFCFKRLEAALAVGESDTGSAIRISFQIR